MVEDSNIVPIIRDTLPSVIFSADEVAMLWQLLNTQGVGAPMKLAHVAAELYATIQKLAILHGIVTD